MTAGRMRLVLGALAMLVLVGVVAIAATGSTPSGTSDGRPPADLVLDTVFSLALLALIPGAALLVYGLMQRKEIAREIASGKHRRTNLAQVAFFVVFSAVVFLGLRNAEFKLGGETTGVEVGGETLPTPSGQPTSDERVYEPEFAWIPVILVVALAVFAVVAHFLASRRRQRAEATVEQVAEEVAGSLDDTLDDLRTEPDPRRAVVAAYARLERALASAGLPRRPAETAEEYVVRILGRLEVDMAPVRRLTGLFTAAKFSHHEIDDGMRLDAIEALEQVRDELRELARRGREEQMEALSEAAAS
jgi:Domain of unknown function (DUF4129)